MPSSVSTRYYSSIRIDREDALQIARVILDVDVSIVSVLLVDTSERHPKTEAILNSPKSKRSDFCGHRSFFFPGL